MAVGLSEIKFLNIGFIIFCLIFIKENVLPHLPNIDLRPVNKRAMLNQMDRRKKKIKYNIPPFKHRVYVEQGLFT